MSDAIIDGLLSKQEQFQREDGAAAQKKQADGEGQELISILGALYIEKVLRQTKQFILVQTYTK